MDVRLGKGPIGHIYVRKEWLHVVRENWKLSGRRCQLGESRATSCKPVWSEWEAPGTVVTIRTVLKGVTRGSTHGLTHGGRPPQPCFPYLHGWVFIHWVSLSMWLVFPVDYRFYRMLYWLLDTDQFASWIPPFYRVLCMVCPRLALRKIDDVFEVN